MRKNSYLAIVGSMVKVFGCLGTAVYISVNDYKTGFQWLLVTLVLAELIEILSIIFYEPE